MVVDYAAWVNALVGGIFIGIAVSLMLYLKGRVTGISGILNGVLQRSRGDMSWRLYFIGGLLSGGLVLKVVQPSVYQNLLETEFWTVIVAGLLVGFGTVMGSGCTSGHGVCGISRLSKRSILATITFMLAGMLSVFFFRQLGVMP